ncbi:MAG TPA: cytochrome c oxidase subunit 3 [Candidatus Binataceae bacterium]|nr:cytochrome c oxidase subunit 3 [Candidatus Binataceae bacterium]
MAPGVKVSSAKVRPFVAPARRHRTTGDSGSGGDHHERPFISNGMLAILALIGTEAMFFAGLLGSFLVFRLSAPFWPPPALPRLPITVTWVNTFVLMSSAVTMGLAVRAVHQNRQRRMRRFLLATGGLGVTFLAVQGVEWIRLIAHGLKLSSGAYGGTFYTLIGCHAAHVTAAVIWLACVIVAAMRGRYNARNPGGVELCAAYWYFVCAIWPVLFVMVYLM